LKHKTLNLEQMKIEEQNLNETQNPQLNIAAVMSSAIAFAEWVDWNKYERFEGRRDLWYDKKSSYTNPLPIKTTEDLWNEFVKHCS
jgi:hypothetical protein